MATPEIDAALFNVESIHHIHGQECLCGFKSAVSRERTKHIMEVTLEAVGTAPAPDDGRLFDLNVTVTGTQGEANVTIAVSGTDSVAVACLALQTVGQTEYVQAIYNGYMDDSDGWEDA